MCMTGGLQLSLQCWFAQSIWWWWLTLSAGSSSAGLGYALTLALANRQQCQKTGLRNYQAIYAAGELGVKTRAGSEN